LLLLEEALLLPLELLLWDVYEALLLLEEALLLVA